MPGPFAENALLFAQAAAPAAAPKAQGDGGILPTLIMFAPAILLFYLLMIRPQQQQEKKRRSMIDALKKNDKVLTQAGIYGTVVSVSNENNKVVLRVGVDDDKGVRVEFSKASIVHVVTPTGEPVKETSLAKEVG
jgi:preprotein translocase subunit YajC